MNRKRNHKEIVRMATIGLPLLLIFFQLAATDIQAQTILSRLVTRSGASFKVAFSIAPNVPTVNHAVQFVDNSVGGAVSWRWEFGDGTISTAQNPVHTYRTTGFRKVILVASNGSINKKITRTVVIQPESQAASFVYNPATPGSGQTVQFTDTTTGEPTSWLWDFGDGGTSTLKNPTHVFLKESFYTVTLIAKNIYGSKQAQRMVTVAAVTTLDSSFSFSPSAPAVGQAVQFTDTSTGDPTSWRWDFGDGITSTLQNPSHVYATGGAKSVSLIVYTSTGSDSTVKTVTVSSELAASFSYVPATPVAKQAVQFKDASTGTPMSWQWDFGDGTSSTLQNPNHIYTTTGSYSVSLTVKNVSDQDVASRTLTVVSSSDEIINALSASLIDVQAAVEAAAIGDTVVIPAGVATWSAALTYSKGIHLRGAGVGQTVITHLVFGISVMGEEGAQWTISDLEMISPNSNPCIAARGSCKNFRISYCKFKGNQASGAVSLLAIGSGNDLADHQYGLIDNCEIIDGRILISGGLGEGSWKDPTNMGSEEAVYVEDCKFRYPSGILHNAIDSNFGARYVFRHNYVEDAFVMSHSLQNGWPTYFGRGTRLTEVYENTIVAKQPDYTRFAAIFLRSGTGVVFNNKVINLPEGTRWSLPVVIDNIRTFAYRDYVGIADGTNPLDGNVETNGYPALDQIGRGQDAGPLEDPLPRYGATNRTPQALEPMYIWGNALDGVVQKAYVHNGCEIHIKENRDYYNLPKPGYIPYPFPHPLRNTGTN